MTTSEDIKTLGLKATSQRLTILELFRRLHDEGIHHVSAEDIYRHLIDKTQGTALATVYRVLTQFEQAGILIRHHFESDKAVFELNGEEHHDHLVCLDCGHIEEFYDTEIEKRQIEIAKERGFSLQEHDMHLYASCNKSNCQYKKIRQND